MSGRHQHLPSDRLRNCPDILCRRTPISRSGVVTKVAYQTARLPGNGTIIWLRNSGRIAPRRSTSPAQWSSWIDFSPCFMTIICPFPGWHTNASGSSTISEGRKEWPKHALFCARLWRSWGYGHPRKQLRYELVGNAFTRHKRSIVLSAEGRLLQRRWTDVGKTAPSQRDLT